MSESGHHFVAGGVAGATSAIVTSPLEVLKTRFQSSLGQVAMSRMSAVSTCGNAVILHASNPVAGLQRYTVMGQYVKHMFQVEGVRAFYKGLGPTLVGIAPTRALYFYTYDKAKRSLNGVLTPNSHQVHMAAAFIGGMCTATVTSPIWVVKTRLQLDSQARKRFTLGRCIHQIFAEDGLRGFYRGLTASYAGTAETALCFVLYENMKMRLQAGKPYYTTGQLDSKDFILAATSSKMIATMVCYPHEVVRTRMRQRVSPWERRYRSFIRTVITVWKEEGRQGLYGGMSAHLARVIPNTAILFLTYESVIRLLSQSS